MTVCLVAGVLSCAIFYNENRIYFRSFPSGYESEAAFFKLLKWPEPPEGSFDPAAAPHWDLDKLKKFLPADGIRFSDVNHRMEGTASREQILQSLENRKGNLFDSFAHLSHIYSIPYKQYSELSFRTDSKGRIVVDVAGWYTLTFVRNGKQSVVVKWEYNQLESE